MLNVKPFPGQTLVRFDFTDDVAVQVAQELLLRSASFYSEPMPDGITRITVADEHAPIVRVFKGEIPC